MLSTRSRLPGFILSLGCMLFVDAAYAQNVAPTIQGSPPARSLSARITPSLRRPVMPTVTGSRLASAASRAGQLRQAHRPLYGRPGSRDVGQSRVISIAVSDGRLTANLPSFTITVSAQAATKATVNAAPRSRARRRRR